ncbi:unnamed protein product [Nezara viridula]|uniref:Down syndrome cell adhesion molecule-like protein Dscam2 n=1 Tax=Nezara viridula TaxID=85310 RepID=A0A9P0H2L1_NEZVI|nr:unnamed protein product [Nezara viridula]
MRAAISCQVLEGDLPLSFKWQRNNKDDLGIGVVVRRLDEYSTSLVIDKIESSHSANYTCIAQNIAGSESFTVPFTVNVLPRWTIEPSDTNVVLGFDVMLDCQAEGYPEPTIVWKKAVAPAYFQQKSKQVYVEKDGQAHLKCTALGDNPIKISWKLGSQRIGEDVDSRYSVREQLLDEGMVSELGISHVFRHDTGVLNCIANNAYGNDEMSIHLIVQETPEIPKNVRVIDQQSRTLQLSWTQPYVGNTPITSYAIQYKPISEPWDVQPSKVVVPGTQTVATIANLHPATSYHFRILAENKLGFSDPSEIIQVTTQEEEPNGAPRKIHLEARSSTEIYVSWEAPPRETWNGNLLGYYVGYTESLTEMSVTVPSQHSNIKTVEPGSQYGGQTILDNLSMFTTYLISVQAFNSRGAGPNSQFFTATTKEGAPTMPPVNVGCSTASETSLDVWWEPPPLDGRNGYLQGYKVNYCPAEDWYVPPHPPLLHVVKADVNSLHLKWINEGNIEIPILAPVKPNSSQWLAVNSTAITLWLDAWGDGGCSILYYVIEYRQESRSDWILTSNHVPPTERTYTISELRPGTRYFLKIMVYNNAGSNQGVYNATTLGEDGSPVLPKIISVPEHNITSVYSGTKAVLPIAVILVILTCILISWVYFRKRKEENQFVLGESSSVAQLQNQHNRDQQYAVQGVQLPTMSLDSSSYKPDSSDYMEDVCPYATFQLSKPPYTESTFSGNIYSGPYHSVRGSFVYHDLPSGTETYKCRHLKEPEYTKVRRKGVRLRDSLLESQESDNLGSTDSEVKKILTLHLPISEYDTHGSDSEEGGLRGPSNQDLVTFRHSMSRDVINVTEESSSSSERSPTGLRKQCHHNRKLKSKMQNSMKKLVKTDSMYGTSKKETSFTFNERIKPPTRFLDGTHGECENPGSRRGSRSVQYRLSRESSFQIDV